MHQLNRIIDLERYPIDQPQCDAGRRMVERARESYQRDGLCLLPGFLRNEALGSLAGEATKYLADAWYCDSRHDVYLSGDSSTTRPGASASPPASHQQHTLVGSVPYDRIPTQSLLNRIYCWDPLVEFIGRVLSRNAMFRLEDPFGACSVNVFNDGGVHGWHFDESEFTVTLMLQAPQSGGEFEYAPSIRGLEKERDIVRSILAGNRDRVVTLPFTPGALLIFNGRNTLHRVTRVHGSRPRLVPVLCYADRPGVQNSPATRKLFWGRAYPGDTLKKAAS